MDSERLGKFAAIQDTPGVLVRCALGILWRRALHLWLRLTPRHLPG